MATSGGSDTSVWLHNKLGTSNDSWTGGSIVSQLNPDILDKIAGCFQDLQPQVRLKLLLSFFHIPRRNLEAWQSNIESILEVAKFDSEPWVCMLAEIMKKFPSTGTLCSDIETPDSNRKIFTDLLSDLKKTLKKCDLADSVLPLECLYLNKNAFISVVGQQPQNVKHFSLKRKPKAAALKSELINKSHEAANKIRTSGSAGGAFPIRKSTMPRKMSDTTPLKGLPSRQLGGLGGFKNQRPTLQNRNFRKPEGGVKLLDITEQPVGKTERKRAKKAEQDQQEGQQSNKKQKGDKSNKDQQNQQAKANDQDGDQQLQNNDPNNSAGSANSDLVDVAGSGGQQMSQMAGGGNAKATPDYAAGLATMNPPTPAQPSAPQQPSYAPPQQSLLINNQQTQQTLQQQIQQQQAQQQAQQQVQLPQTPVYAPPSVIQQTTYQPTNPSVMLPNEPLNFSTNNQSGGGSTGGLGSPPQQQQQQQTVIIRRTLPPTTLSGPGATAPTVTNLSTLEPLPPSALRVVQQQPNPPPYVPQSIASLQPVSVPGASTSRLVQLPTQPLPHVRYVSTQPNNPTAQSLLNNLQPQLPGQHQVAQQVIRPALGALQPVQQVQQATQAANTTTVVQQRPQTLAQQPRIHSIPLTREQIAEAQEMFRNANKVTRPEKALILGFMAGTRENPCPHLGDIVTIKLAENKETISQDGQLIQAVVETHFQMNYSTGEWQKIKKYRRADDHYQ